MSKIDKLKLRKIEEIGDRELKMSPMSYGYGSSGSSDWYGGGGTGDSDCMSQDTYWRLVESGASISGVYVCGFGYIAGSVEIWGSNGSSAEDWWYGSNDWGYGSGSDDYGSSFDNDNYGSDQDQTSDNGGYYGGGGGPGMYQPVQNRYLTPDEVLKAKVNSCKDKKDGDDCNYENNRITRVGYCAVPYLDPRQPPRCYLNSSKEEACEGKSWGDSCRYISEHGAPRDGKCSQTSMGQRTFHCSDLNLYI